MDLGRGGSAIPNGLKDKGRWAFQFGPRGIQMARPTFSMGLRGSLIIHQEAEIDMCRARCVKGEIARSCPTSIMGGAEI